MPVDPTRTCPECGAELPAGTAPGQCPHCLLGLGLVAAEGQDGERRTEDDARKPEAGDQKSGQPAAADPSRITHHGSPATVLGDYELLEEIGHGGMGVVYKARQRSLDRIVALKLLLFGPHAPPDSVKRFRAEAVATAALHHPHIVAVHEVGRHAGQHFLIMDFVEGQSLAQAIGNQPLSGERAAGYVKTIAEAIHYAHERGILHRDLKPSNVLLDAHDRPCVTDFGLAKRLARESELTVSGQVLGSPNYAPPEQAIGKRGKVSRRSDVYALGAILYHALTGRPPFAGEAVADTVQQVLNVEPVPPRALNPGLPVDLETICLKCLEKEPGKRYATAQMLAEELGRFLEGKPVLARPVGPAGKAWRWCRRKPQVASLAAAVVLVFLLGFAGVLWQWRQAQRHAITAQRRAYVSEIYAAQQALKADSPGRALELLNRHRPAGKSKIKNQKSKIDLRGFEWRYLWQECQTEAEAVVGRLPSRIRSLEVSPDGHWLVAGSELGGVTVWNLLTGEEVLLAPEAGAKGGIKAFAAFSLDSALLAFTDQTYESPGGRISLWDTRTRQHHEPITNSWYSGPMSFSLDGKLFGYAVGGPHGERKVVIMDFASRNEIAWFEMRTPITTDVHGLDYVVTADYKSAIFSENDPDRRLGLWNFLGDLSTSYFPAHGEAITAMAISPDGKTLATAAGHAETVIKLWEIPSFRALGDLAGHQRWVAGLKFSPDGSTLASAGTDRTVRLWDVPSRGLKRSFRPLPQAVYRVCFAPDGRKVFSGNGDGWIHRWDVDARPASSGSWLKPARLDSVAVAPDGTAFAGIRRGMVWLGETDGAGEPQSLIELGTNNLSLLFSSDGHSLFAGTQDGEVRVWSLSRRQVLRRWRLSSEPVLALSRDPGGRLLVVAQHRAEFRPGRSCRVGVWGLVAGQEQKSWTFPAVWPCFAVSPNGRWLASGHLEGPVQIWSLTDSRSPRTLGFSGRITGVAFSPDGHLLAACSREGIVKVWSMPAFHELPEFRAQSGDLRALAFSPDSRRLATAGDNEEALKLWDIATWQELITLPRLGGSLRQIAFSPDGNQLTALNSQGNLLVWRAPSWEEIDAAERKQNAP